MIQIIILIIVIAVIIMIIKFIFKAMIASFQFIGKVALAIIKFFGKAIYYILFGPALGISFILNKIFSALHLQMTVAIICLVLPVFFQRIYSNLASELVYWAYIKNTILTAFLLVNAIFHFAVLSKQKEYAKIDYFKKESNAYYRRIYASVFLFLQGLLLCYSFIAGDTAYKESGGLVTGIFFDVVFMLFSIGMLINTLVKKIKYLEILKTVYGFITLNDKINITEKFDLHPDADQQDNLTSQLTSIQQIMLGLAQKMISEQKIVDISLLNNLWLIQKPYFDKKMSRLDAAFSKETAIDEERVLSLIIKEFEFSDDEAKDFSDRYIDFGEYHYFDNNKKFVSYMNRPRIHVCASCGNSKESNENEEIENEWYCSDLCRETDKICIDIKNKPYGEFISDASTSGIIVMEAANKWDLNNRSLVGSQPHGYIAERYNDMVDSLHGKNVVPYAGGDNAPSGADRIVNGQKIQTKYCHSAGKSVGAVFRGENSTYGYFDNNGNPMPVEVPKDQYAQALKIMEDRIKARKIDNVDKVPGSTEAEKAKNLVIKGHATYEQAKAMTKFGTFESLKFDIMDGSIIALKAGSVSLCINATMAYFHTKNPKEALRVAVIAGGKTAAKSLVIVVGAQQLHRLAVINSLVNRVDISALPMNMSNFIQKGYGVTTRGAANRALRGTIVTSIVVIAVTTGPDLLKMVRGRISGAQFIKNLAVATSGIAGGVVGSIIGGSVLSPLGPVGVFIGKTAGGIIGGIFASQLTGKIASNLMEEDREVMLRIIKVQIEFLAKSFMLTSDEVSNMNDNLANIITNDNLERMFASKSPKAFSNFLIKPVVVSIVKQRPVFQFNEEDIIDACAEVVT
jgi:hypothetical protein